MTGAKSTLQAEIIGDAPYGIIRLKKRLSNMVLYRIPRSLIDYFFKSVAESNNYAAYILLNKVTRQVYVGRTEDLEKRTKNHNKKKEFWTEMIAVTTENNEFQLTDIAFLEHTFYKLSKEAGSYTVLNDIVPSDGNAFDTLPQVLSFTKDCLNILGYDLFDKSPDLTSYDLVNDAQLSSGTQAENSNSILRKKVAISKEDEADLFSKDWHKQHKACKAILSKCGITVDTAFTFASFHYEYNHNYFWADTNPEYIKENWIVNFVDKENRKILVCRVSPNSFSLTTELGSFPDMLRTREKTVSKTGKTQTYISIKVSSDLIEIQTSASFKEFVIAEIMF